MLAKIEERAKAPLFRYPATSLFYRTPFQFLPKTECFTGIDDSLGFFRAMRHSHFFQKELFRVFLQRVGILMFRVREKAVFESSVYPSGVFLTLYKFKFL